MSEGWRGAVGTIRAGDGHHVEYNLYKRRVGAEEFMSRKPWQIEEVVVVGGGGGGGGGEV